MALVRAEKDSNAAKLDGDKGEPDGADLKKGFVAVDYPSQEPAKSNADLFSNDKAPGLGNEGTNEDAYEEQSKEWEVSPKTGK